MAPPQYKTPPQAPPLFIATKDSLVDDARKLCTNTRNLLDKLAKDIKPAEASFENVLLPMARDEDAAGLESRIIGFYQAVSTDSELRDASSKAEEIMDEFNIETSMREDIYALVEAAWEKEQKGESSGLDGESLRLLEKERKSYIRNGLGIEKGEKRDRFKEIKKRLSLIQIEFQKNLNEENGGIWFTKKELEGVPKDVLSGFEEGTGDNEGKLRFTFKYPDLFPTLKFALDSKTRQKVFIENENKVSYEIICWGFLANRIVQPKCSIVQGSYRPQR
jgi:metallopeptidase MepB